jgi:hypothetical protein
MCRQLSLSGIGLLQECCWGRNGFSPISIALAVKCGRIFRARVPKPQPASWAANSATGEQLQHCSSAPTLDLNCHDIPTEDGASPAPSGNSTVSIAVRTTHKHQIALPSSTSRIPRGVQSELDTPVPWLGMVLSTLTSAQFGICTGRWQPLE